MKRAAIISLNFNTADETIDCIASLYKIDLPDIFLDIYIVDNGSNLLSVEIIEKYIDQLPLNENIKTNFIKSDKNIGFSGGNNLGIKKALANGDKYIVLLNNDTLADRGLIRELVNSAETEIKAGIVVPKIYFAPGFEFHKTKYIKSDLGKVIWYAGGSIDWKNVVGVHRGVDDVDKGQFDKKEFVELATGCCMLIKAEIIEKIGLLDDKYFMYYEDADFCLRMRILGYKTLFDPKAVLWHKNASSSGGSGSSLQDYYISRNRLRFGMQYAPLKTKLSLLRESIRILAKGRKWQKRGIKDYFLQRLSKGSYGTNS